MQADGPDAVYGIADELEDLLHRAVLAVAAVERDERDVRPRVGEPLDQVRADVDRDDVVAQPLEGVAHPGAGAQRDLPLEGLPALEHRDAAHRSPPARRRSGTMRAPGSSESATRSPRQLDAGGVGSVPVSVE